MDRGYCLFSGHNIRSTAYAVNGNKAKICGKNFESVEFLLHGSFAHTYKGHGTDKALVGGIMGYETDDERIKTSFEIAESEGIKFSFKTTDLGETLRSCDNSVT